MSSDFRRSSIYAQQAHAVAQPRRSIGGVSGAGTGHRRSRSHSAVRDNLLDIRRHATSVAQNSQALADRFTQQLRKYKSFSPIFATDGVYANSSPANAALTSIDHILDSRASFLVRNLAHHRIQGSPNASMDARSRLAALDNALQGIMETFGDGALQAARNHVPHPPALEMNDMNSDEAFQVWLRNHTQATAEEKHEEIRRRHHEKVEAERASRSKYLRKWYAELELATAEDEAAQQRVQLPESDAAAPLVPRPPVRKPQAYDVELQRVAWHVFQNGVGAKNGDRRQSLHAVTGNAAEAEALHNWVEGEWVGHTHRHEAAALRIQSAFRCFLAKRSVHRARYLRRQMHLEQMKAEEEAMFAWKVAVEMINEQSNGGNQNREQGVDKALATINFFIDRMTAIGLKRRAAKDKIDDQNFEVRSYAAVRIQALYRGHAARVRVHEVRHPEIGQRRAAAVQSAACTVIQAQWRRHATCTRIVRMKHASLRIQCCLRRRFAYKKLLGLRRSAWEEAHADVARFAVKRIVGFLRLCVLRTHQRLSAFAVEIDVVHSIARGYRTRRALAVLQRRQAAAYIQQVAACAMSRQRLGRLWYHVVHMEHATKQRKAAIEIQRIIRGFLAARRVKSLRRKARDSLVEEKQNDAATAVQSWYRGQRVRSNSRPCSSSSRSNAQQAETPQATPDGAPINVTDDAAQVIQDFYFNRVRMPAVARAIQDAGLVITKFMRFAAARKLVDRMRNSGEGVRDSAAISIQLAVRAYQARQLTSMLKQRRLSEYHAIRLSEASAVITRFMRYAGTKKRIARRRANQQ